MMLARTFKPAAVGHAKDDLADAESAALSTMASRIGHKAFRPLERKPLLADVAGVQESLEQLGKVQLHEHAQFLPFGHARMLRRGSMRS